MGLVVLLNGREQNVQTSDTETQKNLVEKTKEGVSLILFLLHSG